ncbi:long-chain fatty acid transport protein [Rhodobacter sp. JA431]|uniref:OmpP1/FadL family transporter n=1 Tax=Rhodobacter sp. JA431 TaxID=570013 RepID=UPI000BCA5E5C|nr:outer membrane protein transport protein [Rhodobacter sp. JA431]SOC17094.1 long-chain fatty acid transport protein [Rhodobacter sp. JA431]
MNFSAKSRLAGGVALCLVAGLPFAAQATEGYFALGYGTAQRGVAGAGVAFSQDAMSGAINPAAVASVGHQMNMGVELFAPFREYTGTGTMMIAPGTVKSDQNIFPVPNFAYNRPLANGAVLNFAVYGNGGMNTSYPAVANSALGCGGGTGVFCGGEAGVDLTQLFISATYAKKDGAFSWGIAPTLAIQSFGAEGLGAFAGMSVSGANMTNMAHELSYGVGLRLGMQYEVSPQLTLGLSGQTRFDMSKFDKYAGLFEDGGDFDIPASITAGLAFKARSDLTLLLDVQRIFYSDIGAVGNATDAGAFGAAGGAGFGWDDVDVIRIGAEWQQSPDMTWRFGYAHATNPIGPEDVALNILAPGVVEDHFSVGGSKRLNDRDQLDFSVSYVLSNSVSNPSIPLAMGGGAVEIKMHQVSAAIGWTRKF